MRKYVVYLVVVFVVVLGALVATIVRGQSPVLGLDLQGGVSVRLVPVGDPAGGSLDVAVDIIRSRVDALGVAEAEVTKEGNNIVVNLPGVKDRDKAQRIVGRTAELRFRPVLAEVPPLTEEPPETTTTTGDPATSLPADSTTTTTTTTRPNDEATAAAVQAALDVCTTGDVEGALTQLAAIPAEILNTRVADDKAKACVILPLRSEDDEPVGRYLLGPACVDQECTGGTFTGKDIGGAKSRFENGQYTVDVDFKDSGQEKINAFAGKQFPLPPPQNQMAITLDGIVQSAPAFQESTFESNVLISGDFSRSEAEDLARLLRYGALPVRFDESQQTVENVSPTLGKDQLRAGIAAGLIGIALVSLYMFIYYRLLGLVVLVGLALTAAATYSLIAYLGDSIGLALTLAGVTGLIVSVGVTVDSYVVYFERLKDEVRSGKTVRSSVDRGFARSFQTILAADLVSLIGAAVLYMLAIGSVRGFAFFLGLATVLDLVVAYFFMHPLVVLLARRPGFLRARYVGIASGLDASEATT
ncbi:MAG: protein translocase subunit SecD [Actinomycetota bacterium]